MKFLFARIRSKHSENDFSFVPLIIGLTILFLVDWTMEARDYEDFSDVEKLLLHYHNKSKSKSRIIMIEF